MSRWGTVSRTHRRSSNCSCRVSTSWGRLYEQARYREIQEGGNMESPATSYLYTVALLGVSFMGFAAVVMLLRQTLGSDLRAFDALFARVYMEFGLIATIGAMLPPLLMFWELPPEAVWRVSSSLLGVALLVFTV